MANTDTATTQPQAPAAPLTTMAVLAPALGWIVPGAGHLVQKRWIRGMILMACVTIPFVLGVAMEGKLYQPNTGELLDILGFVSDVGAGGLYFLGRALDWGIEPIKFATADYGTKYIAAAGLLNIMAVVDAYHIARKRKP
jgi:hypothetical protein